MRNKLKILAEYFNYFHLAKEGDERTPQQMAYESSPWRLPLYQKNLSQYFPEIHKANRYLSKQRARIDKCISKGDFNRAIKIWIVLFQRSRVYSLFSLHRNYRTWYIQFNETQIMNLMKRTDQIRRTFDYNAIYNRIYIPKPTGATWNEAKGVRPLGVPNPEWRLILKMINDICYLVIEPMIGEYQCGFRPKKNYVNAWKIILAKLESGKKLYEFDLKACFNRISADSIIDWFKYKGIHPAFGNYIRELIRTNPRFDDEVYNSEQHLGLTNKTVIVGKTDQELIQLEREEILPVISPGPFGTLPYIPMKLRWDTTHKNLVLDEYDRRVVFKFGLPQGW